MIDGLFKNKVNVETTKPILRTFHMPQDKILDFLTLVDDYNNLEDGVDNVAHYKIWNYINKLFPDTITGSWEYKISGNRVKIRETRAAIESN